MALLDILAGMIARLLFYSGRARFFHKELR